MNIQKIDVTRINPAQYNPRIELREGDPDYDKLKKSIDIFGYVEPIVWNKQTGNLVGGHQRFNILKLQGLQEIEVSVVDLPLDKEKALNLALNRIQGRWDEEKLSLLLEDLVQLPDFDTALTGFDIPEISEIIDRQTEVQRDDEFNIDETLSSIEEPITKRGDLIELGPHRILCGDSSAAEDLALLLKGDRAGLLHTDPPYNVNYYGGNRPSADSRPKPQGQWERIYSDNLSQDEYEVWLKKIISGALGSLKEGSSIYIWNGHKQFGPMHTMLQSLNAHISCVITWAKPNFAIGYGDYNQQTEFCLYGWKNDGPHVWHGPTNETTLWEERRDPTATYIHPTQKPIALAQRAIKNSSTRDDVVLDTFLGSGSTLIAAESLKRRCYGIEIDPKYVDSIIRRYANFIGMDNISDYIKRKYLGGES